MKTNTSMHKWLRMLVAIVLIFIGTGMMQAQEAFYIYRNDGNFDGFFYDDVKRIGYSKIDLQGEEHDEYIVQEVETIDSLYRIPLITIDSVGFQQPEIILNQNFYEINGTDSPVKTSYYDIQFYDEENPYSVYWHVDSEDMLPKPGMVICQKQWSSWSLWFAPWEGHNIDSGPFVAKVKSVSPLELENFNDPGWYIVTCEPIEDLSEVFEQFITVEQLGTDQSGNVKRRMAGLDKVRRISGNKELTIASLSGTFPVSFGNDDFSATVGLEVGLALKAQVVYNITRKNFNVNVSVSEDAEVKASFTAKGTLNDVTTWQLGGLPIYFPSFLPIMQINPGPGAFIKTAGDMSVKVTSPKFAYSETRSIHISKDGVEGECNIPAPNNDDNNGWSVELSLNGSVQAGVCVPFKLETSNWAKKFVYASIGADVYVGPKFSASFVLDAEAMLRGDAYDTFKGTHISLAKSAAVFEANATFSALEKKERKFKFFEGELDFGQVDLTVFPQFENPNILNLGTQKIDDKRSVGIATVGVSPRGNSLPFTIGAAAYNAKHELVSSSTKDLLTNRSPMYSFFYTFDEAQYSLPLLDGLYTIVPTVSAFGVTVPAWSAGTEVERTLPLTLEYGNVTDGSADKWFKVYGVVEGDELEFELVEGTHTVITEVEPHGDVPRSRTEKEESCGWIFSFQENERQTDTNLVVGPEQGEIVTFLGTRTQKGSMTYPDQYTIVWNNYYNSFRVKATRNGRTRYSNTIVRLN